MNLFFSKQISKDTTIEFLSDTESQHCIKSLRHKVDDRILVSNGKGEIYNAKIINTEKIRYTNQERDKDKTECHQYYLFT